MSNAITISVDGEDGSVVSRNPGIRLVGGDADLALVRVWASSLRFLHLQIADEMRQMGFLFLEQRWRCKNGMRQDNRNWRMFMVNCSWSFLLLTRFWLNRSAIANPCCHCELVGSVQRNAGYWIKRRQTFSRSLTDYKA